eukprot:5962560-Pyramimonas_sp.AAC.1
MLGWPGDGTCCRQPYTSNRDICGAQGDEKAQVSTFESCTSPVKHGEHTTSREMSTGGDDT